MSWSECSWTPYIVAYLYDSTCSVFPEHIDASTHHNTQFQSCVSEQSNLPHKSCLSWISSNLDPANGYNPALPGHQPICYMSGNEQLNWYLETPSWVVLWICSYHQQWLSVDKQNLDGVICGHIHKAEIRDIDGILYCNDGDWVESLTALVEDEVGELHLVDWHEIMLRWEQRQFAKKETTLNTASAW